MIRPLFLIVVLITVILSFSACSVRKYYSDPNEQLSQQAEFLLGREGVALEGWVREEDISPVLKKYLKKEGAIRVRPFGEAEAIMGLITLGVFPVVDYNGIEVKYCDQKRAMEYTNGIVWWFSSIISLFPGWNLADFKSEDEIKSEDRVYRTTTIIKLVNELAQYDIKKCVSN